jgi:hypothetical protein
MAVKIKKRLRALTLTELAKDNFAQKVVQFIVKEVKDQIIKGISPVDKGGTEIKNTSGSVRFNGYSDSYSKAIDRGYHKGKKKRPVNLTLTGKMLNSLKAKIVRKGVVKVWFDDEKAIYHNEQGAGRSRITRRLLPFAGEKFTRVIQKKLSDALGEAIKPFLK